MLKQRWSASVAERARPVWRPGIMVLIAAWTSLWAIRAVQDVLAQTRLGQGQGGPTIEAYEVLEVVFVAAWSGVRWMPGVVALALIGYVGHRMHARRSES